jgi:urease accessory protein
VTSTTTVALRAMRLLQFGDSMLPVGAFAFSNGVESAVQEGVVRDAATLKEFVATALEQAASCDGIALLVAHRAARADDIDSVIVADRAILVRKLNEEGRTMALRMGRKLAELAAHVAALPFLMRWRSVVETDAARGTYPATLGVVGAALGLDECEVFTTHQYGVATMMVSAALRLMRLSHLDGQALIFALNAGVDAAYEDASRASLDDMATFAPMADILAAAHVKAHVRLFMS